MTFFEKPDDYAAFLPVLDETWQIVPLPIYAMVVMPNHSLALCRESHARRSIERILSPVNRDAHHAVARPLSHRRHRPFVSRAI